MSYDFDTWEEARRLAKRDRRIQRAVPSPDDIGRAYAVKIHVTRKGRPRS